MPRKIRDHADAVASLAAAEASGLDRVSWARRHDIDARSLNAWRVNLERGEGRRPRLVELVPISAPSAPRYLLRFDGVELEVDDHFREDTLTRLLSVLSRC
ncbi:MAG: hypothetical protein H6740_22950 [Alphaproteobacteria bacterium]|nr:hypothetical protein [Alphaproteobacteria bacterium]